MGKLNFSNKKACDEETLVSPSSKPEINVSPTPKQPRRQSKRGCCCYSCLFLLGIVVVLVLSLTLVCIIDYQQGNFGTSLSLLPREIQVFSNKTYQLIKQTPYDLHNLVDTAFGLEKKNSTDQSSTILRGGKREEMFDLDHDHVRNSSELTVFDELSTFVVGIFDDFSSIFKEPVASSFNDKMNVSRDEEAMNISDGVDETYVEEFIVVEEDNDAHRSNDFVDVINMSFPSKHIH